MSEKKMKLTARLNYDHEKKNLYKVDTSGCARFIIQNNVFCTHALRYKRFGVAGKPNANPYPNSNLNTP
jgi:hypothetical protein